MAFGGNMGAGNTMTPVGVFRSPLPEAAPAQNAYDAQNRLVYRNVALTPVDGGQKSLRTLLFLMTDNGSPATPVLSAFVDGTIDGSASDTGVLTTDVPAATQHGIPVNFGPGRGNWDQSDLARLEIEVQKQTISVPAATSNHLIPINVVLSGGGLLIILKNTSAQSIASLNLRIRYDHTLVF